MLFLNLFCFFIPISNKKIVFCSNYGRGVCCNPKYILKEILAQNLDFELVYLCDKKYVDNLDEYKNVKFISYDNIFQKIIELASAKIWIDSSQKINDFKLGLAKKRSQIYINCWHGSFGIKKYGYDIKNEKTNKYYFHFFKKDVKNINFMISNCAWEEEKYRSALGFEGEILKLGHARDDIFYENQNEIKQKVFSYFNITPDSKIALFAPTFRDDFNLECYRLNYEKIKKALVEKFGGNWLIISKFHNMNILKNDKTLDDFKSEYDVTFYQDTHELLSISDILISDYSSCLFDFALQNKPCFIYAKDYENYSQKRGLYYPLEVTPFSIAKNEEELAKNILNFDENSYILHLKDFLKEKNILNDGLASKRIVEFIKTLIKS